MLYVLAHTIPIQQTHPVVAEYSLLTRGQSTVFGIMASSSSGLATVAEQATATDTVAEQAAADNVDDDDDKDDEDIE